MKAGILVRSRGISTAEVMVALAILATAAIAVSRFAAGMNQGLRQLELSDQIEWSIENARTEVATWPYAEITEENIQMRLGLPEGLAASIADPAWKAAVREVVFPRSAKRVSLKFQCLFEGQEATPGSLVFWIMAPEDNEDVTGEAAQDADVENTDLGLAAEAGNDA